MDQMPDAATTKIPLDYDGREALFCAFATQKNDGIADYPELGDDGRKEKWTHRPMGCSVLADGDMMPHDNLDPDARKRDCPYRLRLNFSSMSPGLHLEYRRRIGILISPNECEAFDVEIIDARADVSRYAAVSERFVSRFAPKIYEESHYPPQALHITAKLVPGKTCLLVPHHFFKRFENFSSGPLEPVGMRNVISNDVECDSDEEYDIEDDDVVLFKDIVRKAKEIEILCIVVDARRTFMVQYYEHLMRVSRPSPDQPPRAFNHLRLHFGDRDNTSSLLENLVDASKGPNPESRGPPVDPRHYKTTTALRSGAAVINDISVARTIATPLYSTFFQLLDANAIAVYRELQLEAVVLAELAKTWLSAEVTVDRVMLQEHGGTHVVVKVRADGRLERHHFPQAGATIKFNLCNNDASTADATNSLQPVLLSGEVTESDTDDEDILAFEFELQRWDGRRSDIFKIFSFNSVPSICAVQLLLDSPGSSFKTQLDALLWHRNAAMNAEYGKVNLSRLFFRFMPDDDPIFLGNLMAEFEQHQDLSEEERATRLLLLQAAMESLNTEQRDFLVAFQKKMPENLLIMEGPVGTGKTVTLANCVLCAYYLRSRIVCTARTNNAVDNLYGKVIMTSDRIHACTPKQTHVQKPSVVCVLTTREENRVRRACLLGGEAFKCLTPKQKQCLAYSAYHRAMHESTQDALLLAYRQAIEEIRDKVGTKYKQVHRNSTIPAVKQYHKAAESAESLVANTCDCLCATSATLTRILRTKKYDGAPTVVYDEVSQMTVPEFLSGLAWNHKIDRLVIAGDRDQTGPYPASRAAMMSEFGRLLSYSIFQHPLIEPLRDQCLWLRRNYRNPPLIIDMLNAIVYESGKLICARQTESPVIELLDANKSKFDIRELRDWDFRSKPVLVMHVEGQEDVYVKAGASRAAEAAKQFSIRTFQYSAIEGSDENLNIEFCQPTRHVRICGAQTNAIRALIWNLCKFASITGKNITILAFYRAHAESIASKVRETMALLGKESDPSVYFAEPGVSQGPRTFTVDKYQGDENEITITTFTSFAPDALSFITNLPRMNVAMSRAEGLLIMVMDWNDLLQAMCTDKELAKNLRHLHKLVDFAKKHKLVINFDERHKADKQCFGGLYAKNPREIRSGLSHQSRVAHPSKTPSDWRGPVRMVTSRSTNFTHRGMMLHSDREGDQPGGGLTSDITPDANIPPRSWNRDQSQFSGRGQMRGQAGGAMRSSGRAGMGGQQSRGGNASLPSKLDRPWRS